VLFEGAGWGGVTVSLLDTNKISIETFIKQLKVKIKNDIFSLSNFFSQNSLNIMEN